MNIADGEATGTIIDDDEPAQAELIDLPLWVLRFGRTVTDQSLDMISARLKRTAAPGGQVTIAGQRIRQWSGSDGEPQAYDLQRFGSRVSVRTRTLVQQTFEMRQQELTPFEMQALTCIMIARQFATKDCPSASCSLAVRYR